MVSIVLQGVITPEGHLQVDLPSDLSPGPVEVEIRTRQIPGRTLGEILISGQVGVWADRKDINDSVEFVRQLRQRASRRKIE